jgi:hypothetical protein
VGIEVSRELIPALDGVRQAIGIIIQQAAEFGHYIERSSSCERDHGFPTSQRLHRSDAEVLFSRH